MSSTTLPMQIVIQHIYIKPFIKTTLPMNEFYLQFVHAHFLTNNLNGPPNKIFGLNKLFNKSAQ